MNFPVEAGLPQIIFFLIFILGIGLIISSAMSLRPGRVERLLDKHGNIRHRRRRRRFRWGHGSSGMVILLVGIGLLWLASLMQAYAGLTHEITAARVHATPITNTKIPQMSLELTLYDQNNHPTSTNTYIINGDEWMVQSVFIEVQPWLGVVGLHSGYKLTRLEGMFSDADLERHQEKTVIDLNGGEDNFFKTVKVDSWYSRFVKGVYGSATFLPADGKTYNIKVSQDAIKAEPAAP